MKFQNPSIHHSEILKKKGLTDTQTNRQMKAICPTNFLKGGGIKTWQLATKTSTIWQQNLLFGNN